MAVIVTAENAKKLKANDIIKWCQENNQVEWLKATAAKPVEVDNDGDKDYRDITFIELRIAFINKFFPEYAPKAAPKDPTFLELIKAL